MVNFFASRSLPPSLNALDILGWCLMTIMFTCRPSRGNGRHSHE
jgi:hypothetical protein